MAWLNINFESDTLHMPITIDVIIPQGHGGYKTLYLLHGAGGDHTSWLLNTRITDYVNDKNIAVIMPSGNNKCYVNNKYGKDYGDFISKELIQKIQQWFSVSKDAKDRYIAGMSMGGYGSFYHALTNPGKYHSAFSYSGLLNIIERFDNPQGLNLSPVFGTKNDLYKDFRDLNQLIHKMSVQYHENVDNKTKFYITCGLQDPRIHMSDECYELMKKEDYDVTYIKNNGAHNWDYWDTCIQKTINLILKEK